MTSKAQRLTIYALFALSLALNTLLWAHARPIKARWLNVPPPPSREGVAFSGLGDKALAYRSIGLMLQNLGDTGGRVTGLKAYNYDNLVKWFYLADYLDPHSDFVPYLAAFYFGAVDDPKKLEPLVDYLHFAGNRSEGKKWVWLGHAVYLARFQLKDQDKAYKMAVEMASLPGKLPAWTKEMPAFIMNVKGEKQAAYDIMVEILRSNAKEMDPIEVNFMRDYICNRILDKQRAKADPVCEGIALAQ